MELLVIITAAYPDLDFILDTMCCGGWGGGSAGKTPFDHRPWCKHQSSEVNEKISQQSQSIFSHKFPGVRNALKLVLSCLWSHVMERLYHTTTISLVRKYRPCWPFPYFWALDVILPWPSSQRARTWIVLCGLGRGKEGWSGRLYQACQQGWGNAIIQTNTHMRMNASQHRFEANLSMFFFFQVERVTELDMGIVYIMSKVKVFTFPCVCVCGRSLGG